MEKCGRGTGPVPSLRDRLRAMQAAPRPAPQAQRVLEYTAAAPLEPALLSLSPLGLQRMAAAPDFDARGALFIDTETTGLSGGAGTVAFLVGLGRVEGESFVVRQYLMTGYGAEPMLLEKVCALAREAKALVSFNGRTFDIPLLKSRLVMCRMDDPFTDKPHLDLIYPARRAWKLRLRDCTLGNIERRELGLRRESDLPGAEVPGRYFEFIKTGDMSLLTDIVDHNRQDIVSLSSLLSRLAQVYAAPLQQTSMMDVLSLGKAMEKGGERDEARRCYRLAAKEKPLSTIERLRERHVAGAANKRLTLMLRAEKSHDDMETVLREMIARGQMGAFPYIELAKLLEHRRGAYAEALALCRRAWPLSDERERADLEKRQARLLKKGNMTLEDKENGHV